MKSYIDKHYRHYPDDLWLIRLFVILLIDLIYVLLILVYTIEKSNSILSILFIIIPIHSTYLQLLFYQKNFYRNYIFVGIITLYLFLSKIIVSFLLFNTSNMINSFMNIIYINITIEIVFHFIWIFIGIYNEIRYQRLLEIALTHEEMENLIV